MKTLVVFCVFLAIVTSVQMKTEEECQTMIKAFKSQNDQSKDCPKFNEINTCIASARSKMLVLALQEPELIDLEKLFNGQTKPYSCVLPCKESMKAKACYEALLRSRTRDNRKDTCKFFTDFAACVRKDGICDANQANEADIVADYEIRVLHEQYCRTCNDDTKLDDCRKKAAAVPGDKEQKDACKLYGEAKDCFAKVEGCSSVAIQMEMLGAEERVFGKNFTCTTSCEQRGEYLTCQTKGFEGLFNIDTNMATKEDVCVKGAKDIGDCFKDKAKCDEKGATEAVNALKSYANDLLGYNCNGSSMTVASVLTVLLGAFLTALRR